MFHSQGYFRFSLALSDGMYGIFVIPHATSKVSLLVKQNNSVDHTSSLDIASTDGSCLAVGDAWKLFLCRTLCHDAECVIFDHHLHGDWWVHPYTKQNLLHSCLPPSRLHPNDGFLLGAWIYGGDFAVFKCTLAMPCVSCVNLASCV